MAGFLLGAKPFTPTVPPRNPAMTVRYDIKQVTRYVLTRTMNTDKGATVADLAEFTRRDDAERVAGTMRAAIHPVETPKPVEKTAEQGAKDCIKIGDFAISLFGIDALDPLQAIDLLEARVANAKHLAILFSKRANS